MTGCPLCVNGWVRTEGSARPEPCPVCPPQSQCPACGAWQDDPDGFGVNYCDACRYCRHASGIAHDRKRIVCDTCGQVVRAGE